MKTYKIETSLENILQSYNWAQVFADGTDAEDDGSVEKTVQAAPPDSKVSLEPFSRTDIEAVLASVEGVNGDESWEGVFKLKDGRFAICSGSCDYTGWVMGFASNCLIVCSTWKDVLEFGLTEGEKVRLGITD